MSTIKQHDALIVQDQKTGELLRDSACENQRPGADWLCCSRGTYNLRTGLHVCKPWRIIGRLVPLIDASTTCPRCHNTRVDPESDPAWPIECKACRG